MPLDASLQSRLGALLAKVRMVLEPEGDGFAITYEKTRLHLDALPLDGLDPDAEAAELLAVAAGLEAAVKYPGELAPGEPLRDGAAPLLPKLERRRWVDAYDLAALAQGKGPEHRVAWRDFGAGLVTVFVHDAGWRFDTVVAGRAAAWDTTLDTLQAIARSNLYARAALDHRARALALGDGYDAARATLISDVFYDRLGPAGLTLAIPGRDLLLVGPDLDPAAVRAAYAAAAHPLSPPLLRFPGHQLRPPSS